VLVEQRFAEGATVKVGEVIARIGEGRRDQGAPTTLGHDAEAPEIRPEPGPRRPQAAGAAAAVPEPSTRRQRTARPSQRRRARARKHPAPGSRSPAACRARPPVARTGSRAGRAEAREEIVAMTPLRKRIAERLRARAAHRRRSSRPSTRST
jgi:pyruvate/2-oxoglutarate dehydrogenase complex dihydrolipoamide acyltransferase (E2) component